MYDNPKDVRDHEIKVRVAEDIYAMIRALARDSGKQVATLAHELVMQGVRAMLAEHHAVERGRAEGQKKARKNVTWERDARPKDRHERCRGAASGRAAM